MLYGKYFSLYFLSLFIFKSTTVYGLIDPITGSFVVGAFVTGYFLNKSNFFYPYFGGCPKTFKIKDLEHDMKKSFFGQHIASKIVVSALAGNLRRSGNNKKPLVMSFHGCTGSGKNFLSDLIAKHMFDSKKVKELRYRVIHGRSEFPVQSKINDYKYFMCHLEDVTPACVVSVLQMYNIAKFLQQEKLYSDVKSAIQLCDTNLFVFDEIHYIPMGILDILIPILENNDMSVDSRNTIFIFLTNTGSDSIIKKYLDLWVKGVSRELMKVQDFDTILLKSAFNEEGGLKKSAIIDSHIIDHYVPFLPLEKVHVQQCIEAELKNLKKHLDSEAKSEILQIITFGPEPQKLFSSSGCKRIKALVTTELESNLI